MWSILQVGQHAHFALVASLCVSGVWSSLCVSGVWSSLCVSGVWSSLCVSGVWSAIIVVYLETCGPALVSCRQTGLVTYNLRCELYSSHCAVTVCCVCVCVCVSAHTRSELGCACSHWPERCGVATRARLTTPACCTASNTKQLGSVVKVYLQKMAGVMCPCWQRE